MGRFDLALGKTKPTSIFDEAMKVITRKRRKPIDAAPTVGIGSTHPVERDSSSEGQWYDPALYARMDSTRSTDASGAIGIQGVTHYYGFTGYSGDTGYYGGDTGYYGGNIGYNPPQVIIRNMGTDNNTWTLTNDTNTWTSNTGVSVTVIDPTMLQQARSRLNNPVPMVRQTNPAYVPTGRNLLIRCPSGYQAIIPIRNVEVSVNAQGQLVLGVPGAQAIADDIMTARRQQETENSQPEGGPQ